MLFQQSVSIPARSLLTENPANGLVGLVTSSLRIDRAPWLLPSRLRETGKAAGRRLLNPWSDRTRKGTMESAQPRASVARPRPSRLDYERSRNLCKGGQRDQSI